MNTAPRIDHPIDLRPTLDHALTRYIARHRLTLTARGRLCLAVLVRQQPTERR